MPRASRHFRNPALAAGLLALSLLSAGLTRAEGTDPEAWDAIYVGDSKVGHLHLWLKPVKDTNGRELVNVRVDYDLSFARGKDTAQVRMIYGTIETKSGQVLRLDTLTQASGQNIRTYGDVVDGKMTLILEVGGKKQQVVIPWGPDVRGPYGAEMSLSREPLKPGETRDVQTYIPDLNQVCTTHLKAVRQEDVPLGPLNEMHNLLRVESSVIGTDGNTIPELKSTLWVDSSGQVMKSFTDLLGGMYTYRTTKEGALAPNASVKLFDILKASIRPSKVIPDSDKTRNIVYRVQGKEVATLFPDDQRQKTTKESDDSILLEVKTDTPQSGQADVSGVSDEFLRANPLINSEAPQVIERMKAAVKDETDPWMKAVKIEEWVADNVKTKNFSTAFAPAEEVAKELAGDCTEHGVLTAAMCRAAGVPCRIVVGLVYAEPLGGFGAHLWNEVHVNGRWVAIDSAFKQSSVDATHLKLSASSLDGVAPFEPFLPVLKVFHDIKIDPVEMR